ncbi:hypothetical protein AAE478_010043 [Parahypoxylon ruwenzoriense]
MPNTLRRMVKLEREYTPYTAFSGLQPLQTLDESYYHMLSDQDLYLRNKDQVVYKRGRPDDDDTQTAVDTNRANVKPSQERKCKSPSTIITSLPERWHTGVEDTLRNIIQRRGVDQFQEPEDLIRHIVFKCATFPEEFQDAGLGDHILDIYESAVATLSNKELVCFNNFIRSLSKENTSSIKEEISWIREVKDIQDELHLIRRVFEKQSEVLTKFSKLFWPNSTKNNNQYRTQFVDDCGVKALIQRVNLIVRDTIRTLDALNNLVQVKQAQSSLKEAEFAGKLAMDSRKLAVESQKLNNYIMIFTSVTVIFKKCEDSGSTQTTAAGDSDAGMTSADSYRRGEIKRTRAEILTEGFRLTRRKSPEAIIDLEGQSIRGQEIDKQLANRIRKVNTSQS